MENKPAKADRGRYRLKYRGTECLNCGHPLDMSDKYCPSCSQANSTKKLSLKDFLDEFFASLISYDSKLLKTLSALLLKPGKITRDYINGKRASYTNPFRFLLSLAIVYFLMINFSGNFSEWDNYGVEKDTELMEGLSDFSGLNVSISSGSEKVQLSKTMDSIRDAVELKELFEKINKRDSIILADPASYFKSIQAESFGDRFSRKQEFFRTVIQNDSITTFEQTQDAYQVSDTFENEMAFNIASGFRKFQRQPGSFISMLISKLPFVIFFFLPVFALFIWLVYIRKKYNYTDHLIFSFHNTALLFILLIISHLIASAFNINSNWFFFILFAIYLFKAMRKFYGQGIFKTAVKYLFLNTIFFILALFSTLILFTGNLFTY